MVLLLTVIQTVISVISLLINMLKKINLSSSVCNKGKYFFKKISLANLSQGNKIKNIRFILENNYYSSEKKLYYMNAFCS